MAISGQEIIQVGAENQASGSDTIYDAFNKTANNFTKLFSCASPYTNFVGGNGISTTVTASNGTVKIDSTGVQSVQAGTGVTVLEQDGVVTISASGNGQAGVTNVGISSSTLNVVNSPIISAGVMTVELPAQAIDPGIYVAPTVSVDQYGRITEIANTTAIGTVTSIAVTTDGPGLSITGSPVLDDGTITITNTGVTRVNAGTGIALSGSNGNVTISSTVQAQGTVTRVEMTSNTLTVLNSPITRSGTITVEIPDNITLAGNLISNTVTSNTLTINTTATVTGTATVGNLTTTGNINGAKLTVTGNANIGNIGTAGILTATGNITGGNISTAGLLTVTGNITGGNLTTAGRLSVTGNANVTGNATINGDLHVNGTMFGDILAGNVVALQNIGASGNLSITGDSNLTSVNITYLFKLTPQATAPLTPDEGTVYYSSTSHALKVYDGTAWRTVSMT
jgi:hypothetical protein